MSHPRRQRRIRLLAFAATALTLSTALVTHALRDGIQFFRTPTQALADSPDPAETFRLGGMVEPGSLIRDGMSMTFRLTDGARTIPVTYVGLAPDLFAEGEGAIATGRLHSGSFLATEILAKHDEDYMPRELTEIATNDK